MDTENLVVILTICLICSILISFYYYKKFDRIRKDIEQQNQNLRLQLVTSQIRPHFILNTLGAIRSMVRIDSEQAYDLLYDFSQYIRNNIEEKDYSKVVPFLEEMNYIDTYFKLEKLRFGDKINLEKEFETTEFWVLPLTIQPFVENAVKHGLMEKKEGGTVWIRSRKYEDYILVEIEDNGVGFSIAELWKEDRKNKTVGIKSAMYRILHNMGGKCKVESSAEPGKAGTLVRIEVPVKRGGRIENNHCGR